MEKLSKLSKGDGRELSRCPEEQGVCSWAPGEAGAVRGAGTVKERLELFPALIWCIPLAEASAVSPAFPKQRRRAAGDGEC